MFFRRRRNTEFSDDKPEIPEGPVQWRRMFAYLRPYVKRLAIALIGLFFSSILSLVFPAVIQNVVDSVLVAGDIQQLNFITAALLGVFLIRSFTQLIQTYNMNFIGERILVDIRKELYAHLHTLSLHFYTERRVGELVSRMSSDVTVMRTVLTNNVGTLLQQSLTMVGAVVIMFVLNWRLTAFILLLIPIIVVMGFVFGFYMRRFSTRVQDEIAGATVVAEESFQNIREVKSFTREKYEIGRYSIAIDNAFRAALNLLRIRAVFGPAVGFLAFAGLSLILWFGGREVIEGRLTGGELIAFLIYGLTVAGSFAGLVGLYTQFQEAIGATKRVFQLIDTRPDIEDSANARQLQKVDGNIKFDNVHFTYDDMQEVLHDINLEIQSGEIIALVGPSGAGKSTIFNLIPRFYDVSQGSIQIDGFDVQNITQQSLRANIGVVPQETLLFGGTIRENILYGRLDATETEMIDAAIAANAHDFINELPHGYDTIVGERGIRLSGGQRQRVAIARAILKNPRILLLDEATSSLDNESEHLVQEALGRLMQNRTTIIIAHRLSTVRIAHRIAVLDRGKLVELGTHEELMAQNNLYARLYDMQFREQNLVG